jgi:S-adenosylmethionine decarboxylase
MTGKHLLADLYGVDAVRLRDATALRDCLERGAQTAGLTPLGDSVIHTFEGGGLTGFILLGESHIAFHTYPEHEYAAVDVFTCGPGDPEAALEVFREAMEPDRADVTRLDRGP